MTRMNAVKGIHATISTLAERALTVLSDDVTIREALGSRRRKMEIHPGHANPLHRSLARLEAPVLQSLGKLMHTHMDLTADITSNHFRRDTNPTLDRSTPCMSLRTPPRARGRDPLDPLATQREVKSRPGVHCTWEKQNESIEMLPCGSTSHE